MRSPRVVESPKIDGKDLISVDLGIEIGSNSEFRWTVCRGRLKDCLTGPK